MRRYETEDVGEAAFLKMQGFRVIGKVFKFGEVSLVFENTTELKLAASSYYNGAQVVAETFLVTVKGLEDDILDEVGGMK